MEDNKPIALNVLGELSSTAIRPSSPATSCRVTSGIIQPFPMAPGRSRR
jgi:hypothetical protein